MIIVPFPDITRNRDGPGTDGNDTDAACGRIQRSTSNSSNGGAYFLVYSFKETPLKISGKPCDEETDYKQSSLNETPRQKHKEERFQLFPLSSMSNNGRSI